MCHFGPPHTLTRSENSAKSNHSRTSEEFSRKSNYSRTYAKTGGWGSEKVISDQSPAISKQEESSPFSLLLFLATGLPAEASAEEGHLLRSFPRHRQLLPYESYPLQYLPLPHVSMSARRQFWSRRRQKTTQEPIFPVRDRDAHTAKDRPLHRKEGGLPHKDGPYTGRSNPGPTLTKRGWGTRTREPKNTGRSAYATSIVC